MSRSAQPASSPGAGKFLASQPTTVAFAMVVLIALIILAVLRHLFGSIRVEAGTR